jgi:hypothetical protein
MGMRKKFRHNSVVVLRSVPFARLGRARGIQIVAPVPIEDIVEKYLKLGVEFDDMHQLLGVPRSHEPDILGAMFFDERRIVIDESLDPEENPSNEGRYHFTLAHEGGGHWRLHRHLFSKDSAQVSLLNEQAQPAIVCRSSKAKEPIEWQADYYAACLLMPRRLVFAVWRERFGSLLSCHGALCVPARGIGRYPETATLLRKIYFLQDRPLAPALKGK